MKTPRWHTLPLPYEQTNQIAASLGISEVLATVLARRGYTDSESAHRFLYSSGELHDPFLFPQIQAVCARIKQAAAAKEKICVHGDYDVDGITATALLSGVLNQLGAEVSHYLPNRFTDGYGVSQQAIEKIAASGVNLLITVDCGISANESIQAAAGHGIDVIVIDHHRPDPDNLPEAMIISPLLCDYPFADLAGVGLAFKVSQALLSEGKATGEVPPQLAELLDLVALGTVADVVPLVDENRILVQRGLIQLSRNQRPGLKALMEIGRIDPQNLSASLIAFRMAPRINAAGRLDDPEIALQLLLAEDDNQAAELAQRLDALNRERQQLENRILAEAEEMFNSWPEQLRDANGYVFSSPQWHEGVIGIVASRMVEMHKRPVIMIAAGDEQGKGSGRSVSGFDLHAALSELDQHLVAYGGHRAACGLTIDPDRIDEFRLAFGNYADTALGENDLEPRCFVDAIVTGRELTLKLAEELALMEPFGMGNPAVRLLLTGAQIKRDRKTRDGQHLQCQIQSGGVSASAIGFRQAFMQDRLGTHAEWDVLFRLEQNEYNGSISARMNLCELMPFTPGAGDTPGLCEGTCDYSCPDRVTGSEFRGLLAADPLASDRFLEGIMGQVQGRPELTDHAEGLAERIIDRRGYGSIRDQIARLATTGENVLLLAADVPRRRRLLSHDLPLANLGLEQLLLAGSRCSRARIHSQWEKVTASGATMMLADQLTACGFPGLLPAFQHIVFIDPPVHEHVLPTLGALAPAAWVHLFYCRDEVQFTGKVLEHEYDLRAPLAKVFGQLKSGNVHSLNETTERLLLAGGKYLRQPTLVARCIKVLEELSLISIEDNSGEPILTLTEAGKTELESSPTYVAIISFYEGCLRYLSKSLNEKLTSTPETAISRSSSKP